MALLNHNASSAVPMASRENEQIFARLKNMMGMVQASQNPQMVLQQVAQRNPQVAEIMQMCNGRNPKDVFFALCQQQSVNPNDILSKLM